MTLAGTLLLWLLQWLGLLMLPWLLRLLKLLRLLRLLLLQVLQLLLLLSCCKLLPQLLLLCRCGHECSFCHGG